MLAELSQNFATNKKVQHRSPVERGSTLYESPYMPKWRKVICE